MNSITKKCKKCGEVKPITEFHKSNNRKDGHRINCKTCRKDENNTRKEYHHKWYLEHKKEVIERSTNWAIRNPEKNKTIRKKIWKKYYSKKRGELIKKVTKWSKENRDRVNEGKRRRWLSGDNIKSRNYKKENKEKISKQNKKWRSEHKVQVALQKRVRNHRTRASGGSFTREQWVNICTYYGNKCLSCFRQDVVLTIDHVIPVVLGGSSNIDNIQPLCKSCNSRKHKKIIDYRPDNGGFARSILVS